MGQGFLYGRQRESVETVIDNNDTLHSQVDALVGYLYTKANYLNRKRRSKNLVSHWKARGSQQTLRRIAAQLTAMRTRYHKRYALVLALQDYLHCLEKNVDDAEEETRISRLNRRTPIERWKAEGEAQPYQAFALLSPDWCIIMLPQSSMHYRLMGKHWSPYLAGWNRIHSSKILAGGGRMIPQR